MKFLEKIPKTYKIILQIFVISLILYFISTLFIKGYNNFNNTINKIDDISIHIKELKDSNIILLEKAKQLEEYITIYEEKIIKNNALLEYNLKKINNLNKEYNEKINNIDSSDINDIKRFFSERYNYSF